MGTVVLRPNDFLKPPFHPEALRSHPQSKTGRKSDAKPARLGRRLGCTVKGNGKHESQSPSAAKYPAKSPVTGKVTILKRGETLKLSEDEKKKVKFDDDEDLVLCSTGPLGPEPEMVPKQIRLADAGVYAGSVTFSSPSPRSLPFPAFFTKKDGDSKNEVATKDLRRLLRLDLA